MAIDDYVWASYRALICSIYTSGGKTYKWDGIYRLIWLQGYGEFTDKGVKKRNTQRGLKT